jgi:hypothetical protein
MKERGNYETMGKATLLSTKGIRDDQNDHDDQSLFVLINMITSVLIGFLGLRICHEV